MRAVCPHHIIIRVFSSPEDDGLLAHVEVVLAELVLHNHGDARRQRLRAEHVQLASLPLPGQGGLYYAGTEISSV